MENNSVPQENIDTKLCKHCQKEISKKATRCPYCQADLRKWRSRHMVLSVLVLLFGLSLLLSSGTGSRPADSSQTGTTQDVAQSLLSQNNPNIKELSTLPTNFIGQTFPLYVYVQVARYYNYGFNDENSWYSLQIWDASVGGKYEGVYAYIPKNAQNADLISKALNSPVLVRIQASIPHDKWQDDSNAFLQVNSWSYQ